jgi:hypothetical protein
VSTRMNNDATWYPAVFPTYRVTEGSDEGRALAQIIREYFVFAHNRPASRGVSIPPLAGLKANPG